MFTPLGRRCNIKDDASCQPSGSGAVYNPFEKCADVLQLPTVSPSLFREVVSPSVKEDEKFAWSIDQLAILHPSNIDTSPFAQVEFPTDPEYERRAQEAIDRFFRGTVMPSPWTNSSRSHNIATSCTKSNVASPCRTDLKLSKCTVWTQTELSIPMNLSEELEEALAPFCNFHRDQTNQNTVMMEEFDDGMNQNNTTLRRKLLFKCDEFESPQEENNNPLPLEDEHAEHPMGGVSMIRSSSRMTMSPPPPGKETCSSPWETKGSGEFPMESPIQNFSPSDEHRRCYPSSADVNNIGRIPSPGLSPIGQPRRGSSPIGDTCSEDPCLNNGNFSPFLAISHHLSPNHDVPIGSKTDNNFERCSTAPVDDAAFSNGQPSNVGLVREPCVDSPSETRQRSSQTIFESFNRDDADSPHNSDQGHISFGNCGKSLSYREEEISSNAHGHTASTRFVTADNDYYFSVDEENSSISEEKFLSPSLAGSNSEFKIKSSPYFSSSPIRGTDSYCRRLTQKIDSKDLLNSPSFSNSPPVSPISWGKEHLFAVFDRNDSVIMEDLSAEKKNLKNQSQSVEVDDQNIMSQPYLEGSTMEDFTTNTQETGYNTGSSSCTNFSLQAAPVFNDIKQYSL